MPADCSSRAVRGNPVDPHQPTSPMATTTAVPEPMGISGDGDGGVVPGGPPDPVPGPPGTPVGETPEIVVAEVIVDDFPPPPQATANTAMESASPTQPVGHFDMGWGIPWGC